MCLYVFIHICNLGRLATLTAFFAMLSVLLQCDHFVLETLYWKLKIKFRNLIIIKFLNGYITEGERKNFI